MNEILPFTMTWTDLGSIITLSDVSQRQMPYNFIHISNLRNKLTEGKKETKNTLDYREQMVNREEVGGDMRKICEGN